MRILVFPYFPTNPYQSLLAKSLKSLDIETVFDKKEFGLLTLLTKPRFDLLHLHWLPSELHKKLHLLVKLLLLEARGIPFVWTVHNLTPHEPRMGNLWIGRWISRRAHAIIVHCQTVRDTVAKAYAIPNDKVFVAPHGNFIGFYPKSLSRLQAREKLGLAKNDFVYLAFGAVRPYKGMDELINEFKKVPGKKQLLIAGPPLNSTIRQTLEQLASGDRRIKFLFRLILSADVTDCFMSADCIVLPYMNFSTSASSVAALATSFGKAVLAARIGCIPDQLGDSSLLYDPRDVDGLRRGLEHASELDLKSIGKKNLLKAQELSWDNLARTTEGIYRNALGER